MTKTLIAGVKIMLIGFMVSVHDGHDMLVPRTTVITPG
jgi:hypothetical protein